MLHRLWNPDRERMGREDTVADIVVYTMTGCPHCAAIREFLEERGIEYTERNVLEDDTALRELRELGFAGTPVTLKGDESVLGFDRAKLEALIA